MRRRGEARLYQIGVVNRYNSLLGPVAPIDYESRVVETLRLVPADPGAAAPFLWAGASEENDRRGRFVGMLYSGKIDRAGMAGEALAPETIEALARGRNAAARRRDRALGHHGRLYRCRHRRRYRRHRSAWAARRRESTDRSAA